jgi:hypothetical protein
MAVTRLTTNGLTGTKYDIASADNYYMEPIATQLLASTASTVTFSNIPQNYKHLQLRIIVRVTGATQNADMFINFNGDAGSNYAYHYVLGDTASASSSGASSITKGYIGRNSVAGASSLANVFSPAIIDILDYTSANKFKTTRGLAGTEENSNNGAIELISSLWQNTAPITKIELSSGTFAINSRFSLYGIKG